MYCCTVRRQTHPLVQGWHTRRSQCGGDAIQLAPRQLLRVRQRQTSPANTTATRPTCAATRTHQLSPAVWGRVPVRNGAAARRCTPVGAGRERFRHHHRVSGRGPGTGMRQSAWHCPGGVAAAVVLPAAWQGAVCPHPHLEALSQTHTRGMCCMLGTPLNFFPAALLCSARRLALPRLVPTASGR